MFLKSILSFLFCGLSFSFFAQQITPKESLETMLLAEKAFASTIMEAGKQNNIAEYFTKNAVSIEKNLPIEALEKWQKLTNETPIIIQPLIAEIAALGDVGYVVANYQKPSETGSLFTLWQKQADGQWKIVVDAPLNHPTIQPKDNSLVMNYPTFKPTEVKNAMIAAERFAFMNDHFYWKNAKSSLNPFNPHLAQQVRIYRNGQAPIIGKDLATAFLKKTYDKKLIYTGLKVIASNAGDLACVYGTISGNGKTGTYLRIWRQEAQSSWKIVIELVNL